MLSISGSPPLSRACGTGGSLDSHIKAERARGTWVVTDTPEQRLHKTLHGVLAFGWSWTGTGRIPIDEDPVRGWLRRLDDGRLRYDVLVEDLEDDSAGPFGHGKPAPGALALATVEGAAILLDLAPQVGWNYRYGDYRASTRTFFARTILFDVDLETMRSVRLASAALQFEGLGGWAGLRIVESDLQTDAEGLVQGATLKLQRSPTHNLPRALPRSLSLALGSHWSIAVQREGRTIQTAMELRVTAARRRPHGELVEPLLRLQDLVSILHRGHITSLPTPVDHPAPKATRTLLWTAPAMHAPVRAIPVRDSPTPLLSLAEVGGPRALARWVRLCATHPDVTGAIADVYREGPEGPQTALLRIGVAIEKWVARHCRSTAWASKKAHPTAERALASRGGAPFGKWVGNADVWATQFHDAYNALKHHTGQQLDDERLYRLASSARWLLTAALLDRIAASRGPSRRLFTAYRLDAEGGELRRLLGT